MGKRDELLLLVGRRSFWCQWAVCLLWMGRRMGLDTFLGLAGEGSGIEGFNFADYRGSRGFQQ